MWYDSRLTGHSRRFPGECYFTITRLDAGCQKSLRDYAGGWSAVETDRLPDGKTRRAEFIDDKFIEIVYLENDGSFSTEI